MKVCCVYFGLVLVACITGCVTKGAADAKARAAYLAGQQDAMARMKQQNPAQNPIQIGNPTQVFNITVMGAVKNNFITWTTNLTLASALVDADYIGHTEPKEIIVNRNGQQIKIDPKKLLGGDDLPLEPRDVIEIR